MSEITKESVQALLYEAGISENESWRFVDKELDHAAYIECHVEGKNSSYTGSYFAGESASLLKIVAHCPVVYRAYIKQCEVIKRLSDTLRDVPDCYVDDEYIEYILKGGEWPKI